MASTDTNSMDERRFLWALLVMTFITGLVDAVSFLGLGHVFTANMTGNVVFLGFAVAGTPGISIMRSLISIVAFLVGAAFGGWLGVSMSEARNRWLCTASILEAGLLLAAALASIGPEAGSAISESKLYAVIVLTALSMGLRNATVRRLAIPDMTTTVLTLPLTGLAADSSFARGTNPRIGRRVTSVIMMFAGAATGAVLLRRGLPLPLALSSLCALAATVIFKKGEEK